MGNWDMLMVVTLEGLAGLVLDIILLQRRDGFSDEQFFFFFWIVVGRIVCEN